MTFELIISNELKELLEQISEQSVVAKMLLMQQHDKNTLVDEPVNYISIAHSDNSKISYLSSDRINSIDNGDFWKTSKRFLAKPGSFISKIFKDIHPIDIEKFSMLYKSITNKPKFTLEVISGDRIRESYHYESYSRNSGTLGASCMKHDSCQRYLDLYTKNTNIVSMLVMLDNESLVLGRAILWNTDNIRIMDRIYTVDEELVFHFKKWAKDNNYSYKSEQNWSNTLNFDVRDQEDLVKTELELEIKLENYLFDRYPYMDTFKFFNIESGTIYNYKPENVNILTLCGSEGNTYNHDYLLLDSLDRVFRYRGECVHVLYDNIWTHSNNVYWSEINEQYILKNYSEYSEEVEDYIFKVEMAHLNNQERYKSRKDRIDSRNNRNSMPIFSDTSYLFSPRGVGLNHVYGVVDHNEQIQESPSLQEQVVQEQVVQEQVIMDYTNESQTTTPSRRRLRDRETAINSYIQQLGDISLESFSTSYFNSVNGNTDIIGDLSEINPEDIDLI